MLPEIDELMVKTAPAVIGQGIRMFDAPFAANQCLWRPAQLFVINFDTP